MLGKTRTEPIGSRLSHHSIVNTAIPKKDGISAILECDEKQSCSVHFPNVRGLCVQICGSPLYSRQFVNIELLREREERLVRKSMDCVVYLLLLIARKFSIRAMKCLGIIDVHKALPSLLEAIEHSINSFETLYLSRRYIFIGTVSTSFACVAQA